MNPLARRKEISIEQIGEEAIVYDRRAKKAHCLNKASFTVWQKSDGATSVSALSQMLTEQCGLPEDQEIVLFALDELRTAGLLEDADTGDPAPAGAPSRRELGKRLLLLSALSAFPAIASVPAPTPAMARSGDLHSGPGGQDNDHWQNMKEWEQSWKNWEDQHDLLHLHDEHDHHDHGHNNDNGGKGHHNGH